MFALSTVFIMGHKLNRRSRRVESQSSDRDKNTSETSFTQGNATLDDVSENVDNIFYRNLGSELTEPSQISNEIEAITQRLSEQNSHKRKQNAKDNRHSTSKSENKHLRKEQHASNNEFDKDRNQDNCFQPSEMNELRQQSTLFGVANETLDDTIVINENRHEANYHMVTGPTKNILRQRSNNSNTINTVGRNAEHLFLKHSEPSHPVSQIAAAVEKLARKNPEPSTEDYAFIRRIRIPSKVNLRKMKNSSTSKTFSMQHLKCNNISLVR